MVAGIYAMGEALLSPKFIDPHDCEVESGRTNRCIFGDIRPIYDISANQNALLIIEIQLPKGLDQQGNSIIESYGWTMLDLFDLRKELKRGKFRLPLYETPTDPYIKIHDIKFLQLIPQSWVYLRISYPKNDEIANQESLYPENTKMLYNIPQIHVRVE